MTLMGLDRTSGTRGLCHTKSRLDLPVIAIIRSCFRPPEQAQGSKLHHRYPIPSLSSQSGDERHYTELDAVSFHGTGRHGTQNGYELCLVLKIRPSQAPSTAKEEREIEDKIGALERYCALPAAVRPSSLWDSI